MKQPSRKRIQNNDSEDDPDPESQEKNGGKDWEDPRNELYKSIEFSWPEYWSG